MRERSGDLIKRYGGLVVIDPEGRTHSAMWSAVGTDLRASFVAMARVAERARVTGVFLSSDSTIGTPECGGWSHLHVKLPTRHICKDPLRTASQVMADKREEFDMLSRGLADYSTSVVERAYVLLSSGQLTCTGYVTISAIPSRG